MTTAMDHPLLEDAPERIETERLILRTARGDDAATLNAAACESLDDLRVYMPWAQTAPSLLTPSPSGRGLGWAGEAPLCPAQPP